MIIYTVAELVIAFGALTISIMMFIGGIQLAVLTQTNVAFGILLLALMLLPFLSAFFILRRQPKAISFNPKSGIVKLRCTTSVYEKKFSVVKVWGVKNIQLRPWYGSLIVIRVRESMVPYYFVRSGLTNLDKFYELKVALANWLDQGV